MLLVVAMVVIRGMLAVQMVVLLLLEGIILTVSNEAMASNPGNFI
jgi:hypothetical protein